MGRQGGSSGDEAHGNGLVTQSQPVRRRHRIYFQVEWEDSEQAVWQVDRASTAITKDERQRIAQAHDSPQNAHEGEMVKSHVGIARRVHVRS